MVSIASLKSAIAWIWTWVINDFIAAKGEMTVFLVIAGVNMGVYLLTIPLYLKGKSIRIWLHETNMLRKAGLE